MKLKPKYRWQDRERYFLNLRLDAENHKFMSILRDVYWKEVLLTSIEKKKSLAGLMGIVATPQTTSAMEGNSGTTSPVII